MDKGAAYLQMATNTKVGIGWHWLVAIRPQAQGCAGPVSRKLSYQLWWAQTFHCGTTGAQRLREEPGNILL